MLSTFVLAGRTARFIASMKTSDSFAALSKPQTVRAYTPSNPAGQISAVQSETIFSLKKMNIPRQKPAGPNGSVADGGNFTPKKG